MKRVQSIWAELSAPKRNLSSKKVNLSIIEDARRVAGQLDDLGQFEDVLVEMGKAYSALEDTERLALQKVSEAGNLLREADDIVNSIQQAADNLGISAKDLGIGQELERLQMADFEAEMASDLLDDVRKLMNAFPQY